MNTITESRGIVGRADLLAVLLRSDAAATELLCELLELELREPEPETSQTGAGTHGHAQPTQLPDHELDATGYPAQAEPLPLWHCIREIRRQPEPATRTYEEWRGWSAEELTAAELWRPLEPWNVLEPRLRMLLDQLQTTTIDVERLVDRVARLQPVSRLPRLLRRQWGRQLFVVRDASLRLVPIEEDQRYVIAQLRRLLPPGELWHIQGLTPENLWYDADDHRDPDGQVAEFRQPDQPGTLLVLGDLGAFDPSGSAAAAWLHWARRMVADGQRLLALVPCAAHRIAHELRELFVLQTWQPSQVLVDDPAQRADLLQRLAVSVSPAIRLEPGLLRDLRQQALASPDASLELDYWNSDWIQLQHPRAGTPQRSIAIEELLPQFEDLDEATRQCVLQNIRRWRQTRKKCAEVWFEELLSLSSDTRRLLQNADCQQALSLLADFQSHATAATDHGRLVRGWLHSALRRYPGSAYRDKDSGPLLQPLYAHLIGDQQRPVEPHNLPPRNQRTFVIGQAGTQLLLQAADERTDQPRPKIAEFESLTWAMTVQQTDGSDDSALQTLPARISVAGKQRLRLQGELHELWLEQLSKPAWASAVGCDRFGVWAELAIETTVRGETRRQRLRWIPAGEFWMGSPKEEPGRGKDEVRHRVQISSGYWLFDSACPQWLWESVMGSNPSYFVDPDRPVEKVSWEDCGTFLTRLNERLGGGANFRLPTEAEWEYACRAGTETALYTGALTLRGDNDGPELDEIAWYGGNSGVGYEHEKSYDGSDWPKKQYDFSRCGSRRVKSKRCNAWGLYDMLGNVYEWCSDWYGEYDLDTLADPPGAASGSARVVRGGCWNSNARYVRAAYRDGNEPARTGHDLGFRPLSAAFSQQDQ